MKSNFENKYDVVTSVLFTTIFASTWYRRRRKLNLLLCLATIEMNNPQITFQE